MSTSIDQAFVKQFEREVHDAYQRLGSKLRATVRVKNGVIGSSTVFQRVGKATANTKARHAMVPATNTEFSAVEAVLVDYYTGEWVDRLDELKTNIDERQVLANAGAFALGRKTDELIIQALDSAAQTAGDGGTGLTKADVLAAFEILGGNDVPDDGQRFAVVGWKQWSELLDLPEFASSDFVGPDQLPWRGATQAKFWLGTLWMPHSGLPLEDGVRTCFWYHKTAVGHAIGQDVTTDITWHGDRAANFIANSMSQGSVLIDGAGVVKLPCAEEV
jgi:hypothetical protein